MTESLSDERLAGIHEHCRRIQARAAGPFDLIRYARADIPDLADEVDRLRAENAQLRQRLAKYSMDDTNRRYAESLRRLGDADLSDEDQ